MKILVYNTLIKFMSHTSIIEFGRLRLRDLNLSQKRLIFTASFLHDEMSPQDMVSSIITHIHNQVDLTSYLVKVSEKISNVGDLMKYHCDDCGIIKHNGKKDYPHNNIKISDKYTLYHKSDLPVYSMLIYLSDEGVDFTGGHLCFVDNCKVIPHKYVVVLFDSREVHCVTRVTSGSRKCILAKFY